MNNTSSDQLKIKRPRKFAREPQGASAEANAPAATVEMAEAPAPQSETKPKSKANLVLDFLTRAEGATLEQMVAATGWLPHTTRAALTGLKKKGHAVTSIKADGIRTYRIAAAEKEQTAASVSAEPKVDA